jgi:hypothetical protein
MEYIKEINGQKEIKTPKEIVIHKNGLNFFNPTHDMLLEDGWVEYVAEQPTFEDVLNNKLQSILAHDESLDVNVFYIDNIPVWLDKATRAGLMLRFEAERAIGKTDTTLWYKNQQFALSIDRAVQMLYAIEVYASMCYDNTQQHLSKVSALTTIEAVEAYDIEVGYPDKLRFELNN